MFSALLKRGVTFLNKNLLAAIENDLPKFSKGQKLIANYITNHYDKAAFMTASKLGSTVGVSESTVVRFATEIGFEGYPELQRALQEMIRNRLTAVQRMEVTTSQIGTGDVLEKVMSQDIEKIRHTLERTSKDDFKKAVDIITSSKTIYIIGVRSAAALASFLGFYFNLLFPNVKIVSTTSVSEMFENILRISENDVIIGISFPRYSKRTVNALSYAKNSGAKVISVTDSDTSPLAPFSDCMLLARSEMASFVDSLVAPLSLINALIVAIGLSKKDEVSALFAKLENIWDEYNVYEKADDLTESN